MKKILFCLALLIAFMGVAIEKSIAKTKFSKALLSCEEYYQDGAIKHQNELFNLTITLSPKGDKCIYKEKIHQGSDFQMLTCKFNKSQLGFMSDSMDRLYNTYSTQIAQNPIFEAKLTSNGEIFQKYLVDPQYCEITHSKNRKIEL